MRRFAVWRAALGVKRELGPGDKQLKAILAGLKKFTVKVGWFESSKYPNGTPVAYVATIHEYGHAASGIPARSYFRPTIQAKQSEWKAKMKQAAQAILEGRATTEQVLEQFGGQIVSDVQEAILAVQEPALKEATVRARERKMAKGGITASLRKPLVETAYMVNSLTHTVENK